MIKVNSKVTINLGKIKELSQASIMALEMTGEALHDEVVNAEVIPRKDGELQGVKFFMDKSASKKGKVTLVHEGPYARRLYFHPEYNFHREKWTDKKGKVHDGNPNAQGRWFDPWRPGGQHEEFCKKTFKVFYKRMSGV